MGSIFRRGTTPAPRHAMDTASKTTVRRGTDRNIILLLVVLILSSGFLVGTTATFNALTRNSNEFETIALFPPGFNAGSVGIGSLVTVMWDKPASNAGTGYRLSWKDSGVAINAQGGITTCPSPLTGTTYVTGQIHNGAITQHSQTDAINHGAAPISADGRIWCYRIESAYPMSGTSVPTNAWLSQDTGELSNAVATVVYGNTIVGFQLGNTNSALEGNNTIEQGTYIELTFSQPILTSTAPASGTTACVMNNVPTAYGGPSLYFGMSGTTKNTCDPATETFSGVKVQFSSNPTNNSGAGFRKRWAMTLTWDPSCGVSPTLCNKLKLVLGAPSGTAPINADNIYPPAMTATAQLTAVTSNWKTVATNQRNYCASATGVNIVATSTTTKYMPDPTGGRCMLVLIATDL